VPAGAYHASLGFRNVRCLSKMRRSGPTGLQWLSFASTLLPEARTLVWEDRSDRLIWCSLDGQAAASHGEYPPASPSALSPDKKALTVHVAFREPISLQLPPVMADALKRDEATDTCHGR